jgi:hypothetical protein
MEIIPQNRILGRDNRGPWRSGPPDPPPSCPGCGRPLELHEPRSMPDRLIGLCEGCRDLVILARAESRAWTIAERIARGPAG